MKKLSQSYAFRLLVTLLLTVAATVSWVWVWQRFPSGFYNPLPGAILFSVLLPGKETTFELIFN